MIERNDGNRDDHETDRDADPAPVEATDDRLREGTRCCQFAQLQKSNRAGKVPLVCNSIVTVPAVAPARARSGAVTRLRYEMAILVACDSRMRSLRGVQTKAPR